MITQTSIRLTPAQRVALERVRDEAIYRPTALYYAPHRRPNPRRDVMEILRDAGLVELVPVTYFGKQAVLTAAGRKALEPSK